MAGGELAREKIEGDKVREAGGPHHLGLSKKILRGM